MLDFLSTTDVGRWVLGVEEDDPVSAVSELEVREWLEEQGAGAEEQDAGGDYRCSYPRPTSWQRQVRSRGTGCTFPLVLRCHFPWAHLLCIGTGLGGGQKGCLQRAATARTADRKRTVHILAMISIGRMRVMNKQKKKRCCSPVPSKWPPYCTGRQYHLWRVGI